MLKKYAIVIPAILILITFSSCGALHFSWSVQAELNNDFVLLANQEDAVEYIVNCECYGTPLEVNCPEDKYAPVWGCDGIMYQNECFARRNGINIYKRFRAIRPLPCPKPKDPVVIVQSPTDFPEVKPWPANPRKPANKPPQRGGATLVQTKKPPQRSGATLVQSKKNPQRGGATLVQTRKPGRK